MPSDARWPPTDSDEASLLFIVINSPAHPHTPGKRGRRSERSRIEFLSHECTNARLNVFPLRHRHNPGKVFHSVPVCSIRSKKLHFSNGSLLTIPTSPGIPLWDKCPVVEALNVLHHPWREPSKAVQPSALTPGNASFLFHAAIRSPPAMSA